MMDVIPFGIELEKRPGLPRRRPERTKTSKKGQKLLYQKGKRLLSCAQVLHIGRHVTKKKLLLLFNVIIMMQSSRGLPTTRKKNRNNARLNFREQSGRISIVDRQKNKTKEKYLSIDTILVAIASYIHTMIPPF